jgi:hypothetical protein
MLGPMAVTHEHGEEVVLSALYVVVFAESDIVMTGVALMII